MRRIRPYAHVFQNAISLSLTYRWNVLGGLATQLVQLLTTIFVWKQIFAHRPLVNTYTYEEMVTYLLLTSILGITFSATHMFRLSGLVRKGTLNAYLLRPYSFLGDSFAGFVGSKVVGLAMTGLVIVLLSAFGLIAALKVPAGIVALLVSNFVLLFLFGSVVGSLSFWLVQMWPMKPLFHALMGLVGGALFPLDLLPETVRRVLDLTPFSLFGFVNTRALQGALNSSEVVRYLVVSVAWSLICYGAYHFLWHKGLRRYEGVNA